MKPIKIALLCTLLAPAFSACAADSNTLWLGIVRADRTIVPFALFDGSSWSNHWPKGEQVDPRAVPDTSLTLDTIPKKWYAPLSRVPREWRMQGTNGASMSVAVTKPVTIYSYCETYWGLLMGNAPRPVDTNAPVPHKGFAVSANVQTSAVMTVDKNSAEWNRILALITPVFEKAEEDRNHPLSPTERRKAEFAVTRLVSGKPGPDGVTFFYFEAERDYTKTKQLPARSDYSRSGITGWIAADRTGKLTLIDHTFKFEILAGDVRIARIIPLGTVTVGAETLWVVVKEYYEGEAYSVLRMTPAGPVILIETYGGGC